MKTHKPVIALSWVTGRLEGMRTDEENRRKFARFSDRVLAGTKVIMEPCAPFFGEPVDGCLIDLSAGGMALLASDLIPKKVFLKLNMNLPDGFPIESVITVRHVAKQKNHNDFLHGIEFLNLSPEMIDRIQLIGQEILACNDRTQRQEPSICVEECALNSICKRPQRVMKNVQPVLHELVGDLKKTRPEAPLPADEYIIRPTAAEIEEFFGKAA